MSRHADSELLQLPSDLLRMVWDHLCPAYHEPDPPTATAQHQHALRSTCTHMRDATTSFINALPLSFNYENAEPQRGWRATVDSGLRQLAAFPSAATPTSLHWWYSRESEDVRGHPFLVVQEPQLLPTFLLRACDRLAAVTMVTLEGSLGLGYGKLASLADACPRLRHLELHSAPVFSPAFSALARLTGLQSLSCHDLEPAHVQAAYEPVSTVFEPLSALSALSTLTKLEATHESVDDILPHLQSLASLRDITLSEVYMGGDDAREDVLVCSRLTQLTSLTVKLHTNGVPSETEAVLDSHLAPSTSLVHLHLVGVVLRTEAIRAVASLPHLAELTATELAPDYDLSALTCRYSRLTLRRCETPLQLTWLPLCSVRLLRVGWRAEFCSHWWRFDPTAEAGSARETLCRACEILVRTAPPTGDFSLHLGYAQTPTGGTLPSSSTHLLLALAPLARLPRERPLKLFLGRCLAVHAQHVELLTALPNLHTLTVHHVDDDSFGGFVAAVGAKLPQLRYLSLLCLGTGEFSTAWQLSLMALATLRATIGRPLKIEVGRRMSKEQRECCNAVIESLRCSVGKTQTYAVCFEGY